MNNTFTSFIFVYSNVENDLDIYDNDILKVNRYNSHTLQIYRGFISKFSYDDVYKGHEMPGISDSAKIFRITNGVESNVVIGNGIDVQNTLIRITDGISKKITRDMYMSVYLMEASAQPPQPPSTNPRNNSIFNGNTDTTSGTSGSAGSSGSSGSSGIGSNGSSGSSGVGSSGSSGLNGSSGINGSSGLDGSSGSSGVDSSSGSSGSSGIGSNGSSGSSGANGADGADGANGANGSSGSSGANGANGANGSSGSSGADGALVVAGSTNSILYNSSGSVGGATHAFIDDGNINLLPSIPTTPSSHSSTIFHPILANDIDSRLSSIDQNGRIINYGTSELSKIISKLVPSSAGINLVGHWNTAMVVASNNGTASTSSPNRLHDATNLSPNYLRHRLSFTTNAASSNCGYRWNQPARSGILWMSARGGAFYQATFSFGAWNSVCKLCLGYVGYNSPLAGITRMDSLINMTALCKDTDDTNLFFMHSNASGIATEYDTGITPNINDVYKVSIYVPPTCDKVYFTLEQLTYSTSLIVANYSATTNLPSISTFSYPVIYFGTGSGGGTIPSLDLIQIYEELNL